MYKPLTISEIKHGPRIVVSGYQLVPKLNLIFLHYFIIGFWFGFGFLGVFWGFCCCCCFLNKKKQILI